MIDNPESAAGSCQETGAGGHAGNSDAPRERVEYGAPGTSARKPGAPIDAESDACRCPACNAPPGAMIVAYGSTYVHASQSAGGAPGRSTLEILYGSPPAE